MAYAQQVAYAPRVTSVTTTTYAPKVSKPAYAQTAQPFLQLQAQAVVSEPSESSETSESPEVSESEPDMPICPPRIPKLTTVIPVPVNFGSEPQPLTCNSCGQQVTTNTSHNCNCCCCIIPGCCLLWFCCEDTVHKCPNCHTTLGTTKGHK